MQNKRAKFSIFADSYKICSFYKKSVFLLFLLSFLCYKNVSNKLFMLLLQILRILGAKKLPCYVAWLMLGMACESTEKPLYLIIYCLFLCAKS